MIRTILARDEAATREVGAFLATELSVGDVVLLEGDLGAGKTTLVRGLLAALGYQEGVRSPTFNLIQTYDTSPPVLHADLYRLRSHQGLGLEDYLDSHVLLIEWPDRAEGLVRPGEAWKVRIDFSEAGRRIEIIPPGAGQE